MFRPLTARAEGSTKPSEAVKKSDLRQQRASAVRWQRAKHVALIPNLHISNGRNESCNPLTITRENPVKPLRNCYEADGEATG